MRSALIASLASLGLAWPAHAASHVIKMMSQGPAGQQMVFEPDLLVIGAGDSVHFVPVDPGHNVASVEGMLPAGATPWQGKLSQDLEITLEIPGIYGFRCIPHYAMGMVGLIVVEAAAANLEAARARPHAGQAKLAFARLFGRLEAE